MNFGPSIVAIPGPSVMPERVRVAMAHQMPDIYAGELNEVIDDVFEALPRLVQTSGRPFIPISNGHGAWEMAITNTLSRGDKVLVLECGRFASVWGEQAAAVGVDVELMIAEADTATDPSSLADRLAADTNREIKAVLTAMSDTASSVRQDIVALRRAIDDVGHPALFMVDGIASIGCEEYRMDEWGIDVTVGASQKGLMVPPGIGLVWAGPKAMAAMATADLRTRYWDWEYRSQPGPHYLKFCGTPPVSHMYGMREALRMIDEEGLVARWDRHYRLASAVRAAVDAWSTPDGLRLAVPVTAQRSNAVTTIHAGSIDTIELARRCDREGVTLGLGLLRPDTFRIGHMGWVSAPMILGVLGTIETVLIEMGAPLGASGVGAAAVSLAAPA